MAFEDPMLEMVRVLVDDMDEDNEKFSEDTLLRVIYVAAFQVKDEVELDADYSVSIVNQTISPDPSVEATLDESFMNLAAMKHRPQRSPLYEV